MIMLTGWLECDHLNYLGAAQLTDRLDSLLEKLE
jgi:predicted nucleic acid-binding Zn finger protein